MNETTLEALPNWPLQSLIFFDTSDKNIDIYSYRQFLKTFCVQILKSIRHPKLLRSPQSFNLSIPEYGYDFLFIEQ